MNGYDIEDLAPGMTASFSKTVTDADLILFAAVSGDNNAIHIDDEYASATRFGGRIAHGFLTASVISAALATRLPGPGVVYLGQTLRFRAPVKPGETVRATVTVTRVDAEKSQAALSTVCHVADKVVVEGEALVHVGSAHRRAASAAAQTSPSSSEAA